MCDYCLCKKCKIRQQICSNNKDHNTILVYEDVVGPYEKLIPDTSVVIFSLASLVGIVSLLFK
jgi:hypothetical protein